MLKFNWKDWLLVFWVVACVVFSFCAIFWGVKETWDWLGCNASTIASWVQAIGSITVLYTGFRIANFQIEEQERRQKNKDEEEKRLILKNNYFVLVDRIGSVAGFGEGLKEILIKGGFESSDIDDWREHCADLLERVMHFPSKPVSELQPAA